MEVVGEHLVLNLLADLDPVLDGGAVIDATPDASVADLVLEVLGIGDVTVAETGQARDGEVDLLRAQESGDDASPSRSDAGVRARVFRMVRRRRKQRRPQGVAYGRLVAVGIA